MRPLRTLPPAGTVIPGRVLFRGLLGGLRPTDSRGQLTQDFQQQYGAREAHLLNSGRTVLTVLLQAMKEERPDRTEVIVPGYTCYSVAAAAVRVGLSVRPVDIDADTFDYDPAALEAVDTSNTLALITANLFGIPNDLPRLERFCRQRGIYMIDDAAQAMHARVGDRWVGTFGDAGLFSFDKGKNITTIQGGVLLLQNPGLTGRVCRLVEELEEPSLLKSLSLVMKMVLYWLLLRPWLYWIPDRLLPLGQTPWEVEYPVSLYPRVLAPLAQQLLERVDEVTRARRSLGLRLHVRIWGGNPWDGLKPEATPVFLRYPWLPPEDSASSKGLSNQGERVGASGFYPMCLMDLKSLSAHLASDALDTPVARRVARDVVTLPTHGWVTSEDLNRLSELFTGRPDVRTRREPRSTAPSS